MDKKKLFNNDLPKKQNPHMKIEPAKPVQEYKSVRIKPEDHEYFREYAHQRKITVVDTITIARKLLEEHDPLN